MKIVSVADIKAHLSAYLKQCEDGPVIITKNGKPAAALISVGDEEDLERLILAHTPKFCHLLDTAKESIQKTDGTKHEDFWKSVEEANPKSSK